jgi:hypothetical protein
VIYGVIISFISVILFISYYFFLSEKQNLELTKENKIKSSIIHSLTNAKKLEIKYFGRQLECVPLIISEYDDTISLSEYYPSQYTIAFLYSEFNCQTCVDSALQILYEERLDTLDNFIFISTYKRKQDLYEFKKMNNIKSPIYRVNNSELLDSLINENAPVFLLIKDNNLIASLLVPIKEEPELTRYWIGECIKNME